MKSIKKYLYALVFSPLLLTSCSDSFLEENNPNDQVPATFWINEQNALKGLSACYNPLRAETSGYYGGYKGTLHWQMRADDLFPTRGEEDFSWTVQNFTNTPETGVNVWDNMYKGIQFANTFIYYSDQVPMDETKKKQMQGEAYFLRGFQYFQLAKYYGCAIIRTLPQDIDPEQRTYSSYEEVLEQVASDFNTAKSLLPETRPESEAGRIDRGAAVAFLGKVYVWQKKFAEAKTEFESIMGRYNLVADYSWNFMSDHEFNEESVWEINYDNKGKDETWSEANGTNAFMGSDIAHYFGPKLPSNGGWYKMQPSPWLVKQFVSEPRPAGSDTKWDKRIYTTTYFKYSDYKDVIEDETWYNGVSFDEMYQATADDKKWDTKGKPAYPTIEGSEGRFIMKKFSCWWVPTGCTMYGNTAARINNYRIMRFAEVLFLHAEACLQTGDVAGAMSDINRVRVRAGLPEKQIGDSSAAWEELRNQKMLEFAGENIRWFDLIRWYEFDQLKALLLDRKTDQITISDGKIVGPVDGQNYSHMEKKHIYLPIPQGEVNANMALDQKPDWK